MHKIFKILLFFVSISLFSQDDKRLALVIGNANYGCDAELKNPIISIKSTTAQTEKI